MTETIILQGSVKVESVEGTLCSNYGSIYHKGHLCTSARIQGHKILGIYKGTQKYWERTDGVFYGDIKRQWTPGGIVVQGSVKVGDMDSNVAYGDIKRQWTPGGIVVQGSVKVGDMDTNVAFGDINRQWTTEGGIVVPEVTFTENYKLDSSGNEVAESGTLLSSYIQTEMVTSITYYGMTAFLAEYNADKVWIDYWNAKKDGNGNILTGARTVNLTGGTNTAYMRFCVLATNKDNCYLYDETNKKYLYKGANITNS